MTVNPRTDRGIDRDAWVNLQIRNQTLPNTLTARTPKLVDKLRRVFYNRFEDPQERIVEGAVARAENLNATGDVYGRTPGRGPWAMVSSTVEGALAYLTWTLTDPFLSLDHRRVARSGVRLLIGGPLLSPLSHMSLH